ncbi:MAG: sugar transferase [Eubacterium sp.]|nr:sugar transferase [Eubacterium sp.]
MSDIKYSIRENRFEPYRSLYRRITNTLFLIAFVWVFAHVWYEELNRFIRRFDQKGNWLVIFLYFLGVWVSLKLWDGFGIGKKKLLNIVASQMLAVVTSNIFGYLIIVLTGGNIRKMMRIVGPICKVGAIQLVLAVVLPLVFMAIYKKLFPPLRMLQIYGDHKNSLMDKMNVRKDKYHICEAISVHEPMDDIVKRIDEYDAVLCNDIPSKYRNLIIKYCYDTSKRLYFTPKIPDIVVKGTENINYFDSPIYLARNAEISVDQRFIKRTFDIVFSLVALIITSPIFLITAIAIKLDDGGSIFYKQERCTKNGENFWIYKFRSMVENAEEDGRPVPAAAGDERVTRVGHFIRAVRVDELPQFINILKGEMSVVGPRPERLEHYEKYSQIIPEFEFRLKVKGGLTGYAQVYGKYNTTALDKLKMDLIYIVDYSFLLDIQIILETVKIIFKKESTEGFSEEQIRDIGDKYDI